jgi:hypothetical protein
MQTLAALGLRWLVRNRGLQATSKAFSPQSWAYLKKKFLRDSCKIMGCPKVFVSSDGTDSHNKIFDPICKNMTKGSK